MLKDAPADSRDGAMARDTPTEREVTTDRDRIEQWAEEHDAVPVRRERGGEQVVEIVPRSELRETHEELTWDECHQEIDRNEMVVVYREDDRRPFDVLNRQDLLSQTSVEEEEVEQALLEGETVTTTLTETTVVEQTIVEEATLESEIVDRTPVQETFVDAELITREVDHCEVTDVQGAETVTDGTMLETGFETDDSITVEVEVDEGWAVTKEVLDRLTIETRVVDTEATETDTVETDTIEEMVDVEGVQETILEGDLLGSGQTTSDVVESGSIESEYREGDVVETSLLERKTVEEEMSVRKEYSGEIAGGRTVAADTISRETIETAIAADEDVQSYADAESVTTTEAAGIEEETTVGEESTVAEADAEGGMEASAAGEHPVPTEAEEGKTVVDATGEEVGMVVDVEGDTVHVDPHPSLTDRIKQVLDWGGRDEDTYPLKSDHISRITDDEVQLTVDEEPER